MNNFKKASALLLALAMVLTVAACGKPAAPSSTTPPPPAAPSTDGAPASKYPDPSKPVTLDLFADITWLEFEEMDGAIPQEITKQTGVTVNLTKATDSQQVTLLMSSNDLPDLVVTGSSAKLTKLSDPAICWAWDDLIAQYCPDWKVPEVEQKVNAMLGTDGKFYTLKQSFNTVDQLKSAKNLGLNYGQFHVRDDIYKAIGSPALNTADNIVAALKKVKTTYPDMLPMTINTREYSAFASLVGCDVGKPTDKDGNFVHAFSDPAHREMMRQVNRFYREGFIQKENFTYTEDAQFEQYIANGKVFLITHYAGNDEQKYTAMVSKTVPGASFVQVPMRDNFKQTFSVTGWAGVFIPKNCKDPETAIKLMRWVREPQNQRICMLGIEGEDWAANADGTVSYLPRRENVLKEGTEEKFYNPMTFVLGSVDYITESRDRFYTGATPATRAIQDEISKHAQYSNVVDLCYPKTGTDEDVIYSKLNDLDKEYLAKLGIAASEAEFDKLYDELLAEAEKIGLSKLNKYLTDTYNKVSKEFGSN